MIYDTVINPYVDSYCTRRKGKSIVLVALLSWVTISTTHYTGQYIRVHSLLLVVSCCIPIRPAERASILARNAKPQQAD